MERGHEGYSVFQFLLLKEKSNIESERLKYSEIMAIDT